MKFLPLLLATVSCTATADIIPGPWVLYNGTAIVRPRVDHPTQEDCAKQAYALGVVKTYTCRSIAQVSVPPGPTAPVPPESDMSQGGMNPLPAQPNTAAAFTTLRVKPFTGAQLPSKSDIGSFRLACGYSHMAFDDPIVFPGKPGASHLHTFFGNTKADALSTTLSLLGANSSTCSGGTANQSAYWEPSMIDTATGRALVPGDFMVYYKKGYNDLTNAEIKAPPNGLRMVAGRSATQTTAPADAGYARFSCNDGSWQATVPSCAAGGKLHLNLAFPNCWDGKNLDSPDHRSHMVYARSYSPKRCPASHPVPIPTIEINVTYVVEAGANASRYRLSSDKYDASKPGGYSFHGDVWLAWDETIKATWMKNCINAGMDCHAYLLGDGRMLY